jgi:hypothetical protein
MLTAIVAAPRRTAAGVRKTKSFAKALIQQIAENSKQHAIDIVLSLMPAIVHCGQFACLQ